MGLKAKVLEDSFNLIAPQGEALVARFYERLFEKYPSVKPLFKGVPIKKQQKKLLASLVLVVGNLRKPKKLEKALHELGARHVGYGAVAEHYDAVNENLLAVLGEFAGKAWTPKLQKAWAEALSAIKTIMLAGTEQSEGGGKAMAAKTRSKQGNSAIKLQLHELNEKLKALDKVQAIIEFEMDGTIITANDNFLNALGYQLDEVQGQHHRMFAELDYANSTEYHAFWAKLNRGEFDYGEYKRLGKGGKEVWIEASYNPLFDLNNKPFKVVKYATVKKISSMDTLRMQAGLDNTSANVIIADRDYNIVYVNKASITALKVVEADIQKIMPSFAVDKVLGSNIDSYHKNPGHQRRLLNDPGNLPHNADIQIGPLKLNLMVSAIISESGEYMGNVVEWEDVTKKRAQEVEMTRLKTSLDNAKTNVIVCDREYTIVYVNKSSLIALTKIEREIQKVMPVFSVDKIVGSNIDTYHKNPAHQRRLMNDPSNLPHTANIELGPLKLILNVSAIMSDSNEYLGNVVEWQDVTAERLAQVEVQRMIDAASAGELSERIDADAFEGFYKTLASGINQMIDAVQTPLKEAQTVLEGLSTGDLRNQMTGDYQGTFGNIKENLNGAMSKLSDTLSSVRAAAETVNGGVSEISHGNDDLSQRTSEQASSLEETSSSMEEMTSTVKQNADNAKQASQLAIAARDIAGKGGEVTSKTILAMAEVNKSSKKIVDIISVIDEIAFQTNLLALNAAVEAARAGEHGRGFAVVAAEVRNLAQRSATAAKEIKSLINESVQQVTDSTNLVNQSGKTLEEIVESVKRVTDVIGEISAASQEQSIGIDQVNKAITQMDETTQQNAALVEQAASTSHAIKDQGEELLEQVAFFKFDDFEEDYDRRPRREAPERHYSEDEGRYESRGGRERRPIQRSTPQSRQRSEPGAYAPASRRFERRPLTSATRKPENGNGNGGSSRHKQELDDFDEF